MLRVRQVFMCTSLLASITNSREIIKRIRVTLSGFAQLFEQALDGFEIHPLRSVDPEVLPILSPLCKGRQNFLGQILPE